MTPGLAFWLFRPHAVHVRDLGAVRRSSRSRRSIRPRCSRDDDRTRHARQRTSSRSSARARAWCSPLKGVSTRPGARRADTADGPSGSGKTTLLSILGCIMKPTSGTLRIAGDLIEGMSPEQLAKSAAITSASFSSPTTCSRRSTPSRTFASLSMCAASRASPRRAASEEVLREVGLGHRLTNYPRNLSGGEQQRVAVARAIASSPSIVLADEPTAALDGENGHAVMALLSRIAKEQNRSVLAVTHDPRTLGLRRSGRAHRRRQNRRRGTPAGRHQCPRNH